MLHIEGITQHFQGKPVLNGITISANVGESYVLLGASGAGKSVLLRIIAGLDTPVSGNITIDSMSPIELQKKGKIGVVFQNNALFDGIAVWENIAFYLLNVKNIDPYEGYKIALEKLRDVELDESIADLFVDKISGGMKRRVALARALLLNPSILLFDEPTTGLDPILANSISKLIKNVSSQFNITTFTITHDIHNAMIIADRIGMLCNGNIIWEGTPKEFLKSDNEYVRKFIRFSTLDIHNS